MDITGEFLRLKRIAEYEKETSTPLSIDDYAAGIKQAIDEIERGEGIDEADLIREIEMKESEYLTLKGTITD